MKQEKTSYERPVMALLDLLGRRWTLRILWELRNGSQSFRSLQNLCGGVSPTVMSKRLSELRESKIINLTKGQGYSITPEGLTLCVALFHINNWANNTASGDFTHQPSNNPAIRFCPYCGIALILKKIEDKDRLSCPAENCNYVFWDNPVPVVAALVEHDGSIILARNTKWPENVFGLVTGFLEKNETTEQAIKREVKEELGLDTLCIDYIGIHSFFEMNQLIIGYHIKTQGKICLNDEIAEIKPVEINKIKAWTFGTGFIVQQWLEKFNKQ